MTIPKYDELLHPILALAVKKNIWHSKEIIQPLGEKLGLSAEEMVQSYPSRHAHPIFADRISWAISLLYRAGLLERPKRAHYRITELGRKNLAKTPEVLRLDTHALVNGLKTNLTSSETETVPSPDNEKTPHEQLNNAYQEIREAVYRDILETILRKTPSAFEHLVVQLLQLMGYGGEIKDSALVTQQSRDGGIDGIIKEDVLGFGRIYIQAKRYQIPTSIQRPEIQAFAGALAGVSANKGVFITTARFSEGAKNYAQNLPNARIVLIDGMTLAEYIYDYNLGMQTEQTLYIKKPDGDFWDNLEDDPQQ